MKWTGKDVANLMRNAKYKWNSGALANGDTNCAVGMVARALGAPQDHIEEIGTHGFNRIFSFNDSSDSKLHAAQRIEEHFADTEFDVESYEKRIKRYCEDNYLEMTPDCKLLDKVKELHGKD